MSHTIPLLPAPTRREWLWLTLAVGLALVLRLQVWHWREFYPLGGDEQEYFAQALTLLRERRYTELQFMRPPLYGVFLAGVIYLSDSLVQQLRLVQAILSAVTVIPIWLLTRRLVPYYQPTRTPRAPRALSVAPTIAALLTALNYTLAMRATELLTETLFLFLLSILLWLLVGSARTHWVAAGAAGVVLALLCLTRSVGLVLLPLGGLWLLAAGLPQLRAALQSGVWRGVVQALLPAVLFGAATLAVLAPWTARNYLEYGGLIVIDTTGAENLWLDNDPQGREAVKQQLYALGEDRLLRQQLGSQNGIAAIREHPAWFWAKVQREALLVFALEYTDDMRERQAIWVPPAEVWVRLLLGDALWLGVLLGGLAALCAPHPCTRPRPPDPRWLLGLWGAYIVLTMLIFHVELRYRLPLLPVLIAYTAMLLTRMLRPRYLSAVAVGLALIVVLAHRPYPVLAWQLGRKHAHLMQAHTALATDPARAYAAASAARRADPNSALARVAQAQAQLGLGDLAQAEADLLAARTLLPAHPYAHLLLGDLWRARADADAELAIRTAFSYETAALQDLQAWLWERAISAPPAALDLGSGLDLGFVRGFHFAEADAQPPSRWTRGPAHVRLSVADPAAPEPRCLTLRVAAGRPTTPPASPVALVLTLNGQQLETLHLTQDWATYTVPLPPNITGTVVIGLDSPTFRPRHLDPTSPDGRTLGVRVDLVAVGGCAVTGFSGKPSAARASALSQASRVVATHGSPLRGDRLPLAAWEQQAQAIQHHQDRAAFVPQHP